MRRTSRLLVVTGALLGLLAACGSDAHPATSTAPAGPPVAGTVTVAGDVTVFAAASLTAAFTEIGDAFMAEHPATKVKLNFAASSELVTQIGQGAPADVFASADEANMKKLTDAGDNATAPAVFATNRLEIIVEPGNPRGITGVAGLTEPGLVVVTCAAEVPCGKYASRVFQAAGVHVTPKSFEKDVKAVVAKVTLGEADAGIVYATDVAAAGDKAAGVDIPVDQNVVAEYPIAVTRDAANPAGAQAFVDFVEGDRGRRILASYGFLAP